MKKVVIYSSDSCIWCSRAKEFFKEKGIEYEEKNVSKDMEARQHLIKNGIMGVPVIYIDDEMVHGFDQGKIESLLGL